MSRAHYWSYLLNEEGQPVDAANITIYLATTSTAAYVFSVESGGIASNTAPQTTTNDEGFFEFWIGASNEINGYDAGQKFKITWSSPGTISDGEIDNMEILTVPGEVDETDTDTLKNKFVSNLLAKGWSAKTDTLTSAIASASWQVSGGDNYYELTHNLNNSYPLVMLYNDADNKTDTIEVETLTINSVRLWKTDTPTCHVTVIG